MIEASNENPIAEYLTKFLGKVYTWIDRSNFRQKALSLVILAIIIYGAGIAYTWTLTDASPMSGDVVLFRERTQTILDGGVLYRDVHTETPPLINYVMVPAQLLGGADHTWVYAAYASGFALLLALLMYLWFRRYDERSAYLVGLLTLLCPFMFSRSIVGDDDSIVAFFFMLGAVSLLFEKPLASAAAIVVGVWVKMWSILLFPVQFLRLRSWKERLETIAVAVIVSALVVVPYLLLCYDQFADFLSYYFLLKSNRTEEGFSILRFLQQGFEQGGIAIPSLLVLAIVLIALLAAVLYSHRKGWGAWKSATFIMIVFIAVYPKMHQGYYIMPMALLMIWAIADWKVLIESFAAFIPLTLASRCEPGMSGYMNDYFGNAWLPGLVLAAIGTLLFIDAARRAFQRETFVDRGRAAHGAGRPSDDRRVDGAREGTRADG